VKEAMIGPLVEAWDLNHRATLFLLDQITEEQLEIPLEKGKGLRAQFAHLVNVRRMWLKMYGRDHLDTEEKSDRFRATKDELTRDLIATGAAIGKVIARAESPDKRVKGHRLHAAGMMASMVAHEGYHRGQVELALRQAGLELPDETQIKLWEWHRL
jgi:uncharacterized damage-inducible protein DinB